MRLKQGTLVIVFWLLYLMILFDAFHIPDTAVLVTGTYDPVLVTLSLLIAIFSAFMGFTVASLAATTPSLFRRRMLLTVGSVALGGGIWSMHFLGMLAFNLCTPVTYDFGITAASAVPGIAAAWVALYQLTKATPSGRHILFSGVLVGAGIGTMHYAGMAAMQMAPLLRYSVPLFLLSIVVAVVLAMIALWIKFGLAQLGDIGRSAKTFLASVVMGVAIAGMHYTGMAAARFVKPPGLELSAQPAEISSYLAIGIAVFTILIIAMVLGVSLVFKYKDMTQRAIESERTQRATMETAVDGVITLNAQGTIRSANPAMTAIVGYATQELVGESVFKLIPEDRRHIYETIFSSQSPDSAFSDIVGTSRDVEVIDKAGHSVPVRVGIGYSSAAKEPLFVVFMADIRQRIEMEQAIRESEAKFRAFISNIPGIAYRCLNEKGWPMVFISDAATEITGYAVADFCLPNPTISFDDLYHPDDRALIEQALNTQGDQSFSLEYRIINKSGEVRWMREHGTYAKDENDNITWLDGFIMDISDRRDMEEALKDAKERAENAAATRATFLANMSHEIRTPMNAIIGFSDLLLAERHAPQTKDHLNTINRSARSLLHLLNDILDSAKLDKGKLDLEYRDFILSNEVDMVISTFWLEAKRKGINLQVELATGLAQAYRGVPERIRQVLNNLIGNAVKFTSEGNVYVHVHPDGDDVVFDVNDTGIGMTPEQSARVFDSFSQADASMSRRFGGTGLGTTISKQLVELMGGRIYCESEIGEGSTFSFRLPLTKVKTPVEQDTATAVALPPMTILVVDDIEQNVQLLKILLARHGHTVITARDGLEALEQMQHPEIELVLMDLQMPNMDGLTSAQRRRAYENQHNLPAIPIVALTASVLMQDREAAEDAGMQGFANKPVDFALLSREIARVLDINVRSLPQQGMPNDQDATTLRHIDAEKGALLWGGADTHRHEVKRFIEQTEKLDALKTAFANSDAETVRKVSHGLKGVTGNLCLNALMRLFRQIEMEAGEGVVASSRLAEVERALGEVNTWVAEVDTNAGERESNTTDSAELRHLLAALLLSVKENRLDDDVLQSLAQAYSGRYNDVSSILMDIDDFEFERATAKLESLLDELNTERE